MNKFGIDYTEVAEVIRSQGIEKGNMQLHSPVLNHYVSVTFEIVQKDVVFSANYSEEETVRPE